MSINLLEILKDQISGPLAKEASSYLGASEDSVSGLLEGVFPALVGSMIDKGGNKEGANGIMDLIGGLDLDMLGNIGNLFQGGSSQVNGLLSSGGGILDMLMGDKIGGIVDFFAKKSGLGGGTISSLIKLAAPFILGKIGGIVKDKGVSALMDLLSGQKKNVASSLPSGLGSIMGLSGFGDLDGLTDTISSVVDSGESLLKDSAATTGKVTSDAASAIGDASKKLASNVSGTANSGLGFLKWLLPVIVLAVLAYFMIGKGCGNATDNLSDATTTIIDSASDMAGDAAEAATNAADKAVDATSTIGSAIIGAARSAFETIDATGKAALDKITFTANSAGKQMMDFVNGNNDNPIFRFNNLTFASGSATIDQASVNEVDNIAAILKAYPGVNISVEGHTDNTGDAANNKSLSQTRSESVKARLIARDIDASRISVTGYGDEQPIADNSTEEGRKQNRRIEIKIITE